MRRMARGTPDMALVSHKVFQARLKSRAQLPIEDLRPAQALKMAHQASDLATEAMKSAKAAIEAVDEATKLALSDAEQRLNQLAPELVEAVERSQRATLEAAEASGMATKATAIANSVKAQVQAFGDLVESARALAVTAKERAESVEPRFRDLAAQHQNDAKQLANLSGQVQQAIAQAGANRVLDVQFDANALHVVFSDGKRREIKWPKPKQPKLTGGSGPSFIREIQFRSTTISASQQFTPDYDLWLVNAAAGDVDVYLPLSTSMLRRRIEVKKINATGGDVFVHPAQGSTDQVEYDTDVKLSGDCRPSAAFNSIDGGWVLTGVATT